MNNCLFCPTEDYLYGQVDESEALMYVNYLNEKFSNLKWRIDKSPFQFTALPKLRKNRIIVDNPCYLQDNHHVWITCAPEGSTCRVTRTVTDNYQVLINPSVYCLYKEYITLEEL